MLVRLMCPLLTVAGFLISCSSASTSSPSPAAGPSTTGSTTLSSAYTKKCSGCHGAAGATKLGSAALKGSTTAQATWESAIRKGVGSMDPFATSVYSDTDMKADYTILTGKTWK